MANLKHNKFDRFKPNKTFIIVVYETPFLSSSFTFKLELFDSIKTLYFITNDLDY